MDKEEMIVVEGEIEAAIGEACRERLVSESS
jgi:hypothetical protein